MTLRKIVRIFAGLTLAVGLLLLCLRGCEAAFGGPETTPTCDGRAMSPGDLCNVYRNGKFEDQFSYEERVAGAREWYRTAPRHAAVGAGFAGCGAVVLMVVAFIDRRNRAAVIGARGKSADEINPWVRWAIPNQLAQAERSDLTHRPGWATLAGEPVLSFVANARDGHAQRFDHLHVTVTVAPETSPRKIRKLFPGSYIQWVRKALRDADVELGKVDVAHCLVCRNGGWTRLYLTYLPENPRDSAWWPRKLVSREEVRDIDKLW